MLLVHLKLWKHHDFLPALDGNTLHSDSGSRRSLMSVPGVDNGGRGHCGDPGRVHLSVPWRADLDPSQSFRSLPPRWH